jgi:raffinose/stachyose/melibiose transport system substrate-binding protein
MNAPSPNTSRALRLLLPVVAMALIAAACTPGGEATQASLPPPPATTGVPDTGPITLTVWDQESGQVSKVWEQLNAEFEAKYPNVTIQRVNRDLGELKALLRLAMQGENGPDIAEVNQGWPDMGALVKGGLLLPLDNYAEAYGWNDRVSENVLSVSSWSPDGKQWGTGNLFGYTTMGEIVGVYYNKQTLADLGLQVPTTLAEFEQALETAKQAGEVPIQFGNNDAFPGIHEYAVVQDRTAATSYLTDLIFGAQGTGLSFDTPENVQAASILQDWVAKGYFTPGFGGGGYDDAVANFAKGEGLFMITGNWIVENLGADSTDFGFFLLPGQNADDPAVSTGGAGYPLSIAAGSEHPDAAAAYIDWMTSEHASDLLLPTGQIPLNRGVVAAAQPGSLLAEVLDAVATANADNGVVPYEDWATPTFYDTLTASIQELMADRISPEEFAAKVQEDYAAFQSSRA